MENKNKKIIELFIAFSILVISFCSFASAFGFSTPYTGSNPMVVYPGETNSFDIKLKSSTLEGDVIVKAELVDGNGVATLKDSNLAYPVSPGKDGVVNVDVNIPENTPIGQKYSIVFKFSDVTPSEQEGTVTFASSSLFSMGVLVQEKPIEPSEAPPIPTEEPTPEGGAWGWLIAIAILIIIIAIIIYLVFRRKKQ